MTRTDWHTKQQAAQHDARQSGLTHPSDRALHSAVELPPDIQIELYVQGGIARTIDGRYLLVRSGGKRRSGMPSFWRLYRYTPDRTAREQIHQVTAHCATDAIEQANAWLAAYQETV